MNDLHPDRRVHHGSSHDHVTCPTQSSCIDCFTHRSPLRIDPRLQCSLSPLHPSLMQRLNLPTHHRRSSRLHEHHAPRHLDLPQHNLSAYQHTPPFSLRFLAHRHPRLMHTLDPIPIPHLTPSTDLSSTPHTLLPLVSCSKTLHIPPPALLPLPSVSSPSAATTLITSLPFVISPRSTISISSIKLHRLFVRSWTSRI